MAVRVEACTTTEASCASAGSRSFRRLMPVITPCEGSAGVVRHLSTRVSPVSASNSTKSVNVPPMSHPKTYSANVGWLLDQTGGRRWCQSALCW